MRSGLKIGDVGELEWIVGAEHTIHLGSIHGPAIGLSGVTVFSTPNMILLMERAARRALEPYLEPGEESVGVRVEVDHLSGTPIGAAVRGVAKVIGIDGRNIEFQIDAYDEVERIGQGTHRRAVVPLSKLSSRIVEKTTKHSIGSVIPTQVTMNSGSLPNFETLQVETKGAIVHIRFHRPAKRNAVNLQMTAEWEQVNAWLAGHPELAVVILSGDGESFCAGDDVKEVGTLELEAARQLSLRQARMYLAWEQLPQIMIGAIHGNALGAGCVAACACDFRLAAYDAKFGMPEILLGWPPGYGIAQLTALIGKSRAMQMCVTGEPINARTAFDYGLVHQLHARNELTMKATEFAQRLLQLPKAALRETKRLLHLDEGVQPKGAYMADTAAYIRCLALEDAREGINAFLEKRQPKFS